VLYGFSLAPITTLPEEKTIWGQFHQTFFAKQKVDGALCACLAKHLPLNFTNN